MALYDYQGDLISSGCFANVMDDYGAKGNGTADDATAIQNALDALKETGGVIYFPQGAYAIGTMLHFYSNQTLLFASGASLKAKSGISCIIGSHIDTTITGYNGTHDVVICGGTFDGAGLSQNILLLGTVHAKNITIENCSFVNVYGLAHNIEINSSLNVRIHDCYFSRGNNTNQNGEMIQLDRASVGVYVEDINTDNTNCKLIDIYECTFGPNTASPAVGNHSGTPNLVNVHDCIFDTFTGTRGAIDLSATNVSVYNNIFLDCTTGVASSGSTHYIHDNRFVGVTTAAAGSTSVVVNNMINGSYVAVST